MEKINLYTPTKAQELFHKCSADEVLYGGAAGGGKSKAIVMEAFMRCMEYPKTNAYLFRKTYRELEDTLIAEARSCIPPSLGTYVGVSHELRLKNGSTMRFRYCQSETDRFKYQGAEIHHLFIDELTHFTKTTYDYLKTRLRAKKEFKLRPQVRCSANPGGVGHGWVKAYFIDPMPLGGEYTKEVYSKVLQSTQYRRVAYIPAKATDNPYISEDYIFELEQKPPTLKAALLYGDWNAFEGQVFTEFVNDPHHYMDRINTHVIAPFFIPPSWPHWRSFDFGYSRPFSIGWWAVSPENRVYRYREWYGAKDCHNNGLKMDPKQIAREVLRGERQYDPNIRFTGIADPSIFDSSRGESIAMQMESEGIYFLPGDNARIAGKMQYHNRFAFDNLGRPQIYIFNTCKNFIRTVPNLIYDVGKVEDVCTTGEDHIYDEARYFLMANPVGKPEAKHIPRDAFDPFYEKPKPKNFMNML